MAERKHNAGFFTFKAKKNNCCLYYILPAAVN